MISAVLFLIFRIFQGIGEFVSDASYDLFRYRLATYDLGYSAVGGFSVGLAYLPLLTVFAIIARAEGWSGLWAAAVSVVTHVTISNVLEFAVIEFMAGLMGLVAAFGSGALAWALNGFRDDFPD